MTEKITVRQKIGAFSLQTESVEGASNAITERLAMCYCLLQPEKSPTDFIEEILKPLYGSTPDVAPALIFRINSDHSRHTYPLFMQQLVTASAHCVDAEAANEVGRSAEAWQHVSNAMYHVGMLEGTIILEPAIDHIITSRSSSGAKRRDEKYGPLRELARDLAGKKAYTSRRQAALAIKDEILAEAARLKVGLSETQAERTITSWLDGMSFASKRQP